MLSGKPVTVVYKEGIYMADFNRLFERTCIGKHGVKNRFVIGFTAMALRLLSSCPAGWDGMRRWFQAASMSPLLKIPVF